VESYHFRRPEMMIVDEAEVLEILAGQQIMTLAFAQKNQPYLATVDYVFDPARRCFYFHSATHGKKVDYLTANPKVWGQVLEDRGYIQGRCDHAYRTVQFLGEVEFLEDIEEKRAGLALMIRRFEAEPGPLQARLLLAERLNSVLVGRIRVIEMTAKRGN